MLYRAAGFKWIGGDRVVSRVGLSAALAGAVLLSGCNNVTETLQPRQTFTQGYVIDEDTLALVPVGSSREQVLLALGTPSTEGTYGNREAFYYISQTRTRAAAFAKAKIVDQRVLAVYFDDEQRVSQIAEYGLQDGKVFDFISRTTPTGGADAGFIVGVIRGFAGQSSSQSARQVGGDILGN